MFLSVVIEIKSYLGTYVFSKLAEVAIPVSNGTNDVKLS
jgi:hypothetical protein